MDVFEQAAALRRPALVLFLDSLSSFSGPHLDRAAQFWPALPDAFSRGCRAGLLGESSFVACPTRSGWVWVCGPEREGALASALDHAARLGFAQVIVAGEPLEGDFPLQVAFCP